MARPGKDATRELVAEKGDVEPEQLPARRVAHVHAHTRVLHHKVLQQVVKTSTELGGTSQAETCPVNQWSKQTR